MYRGVSVSVFASLISTPIGIASSAEGLKICVKTAGIKTSRIKKRRKKRDKIVVLAKDKFSSTKVLISKVLIDSYITRDEFVLVNNDECDDIKETMENLEGLDLAKILNYI